MSDRQSKTTDQAQRWVFLIGFPGVGKTTIGKILAGRLGARFIDLDENLEKAMRKSITAVFREHGEKHFRSLERLQLMRLLSKGHGGVIALGGGAFQSTQVRDLARQHATTVYLSCTLRELYRRIGDTKHRPLLLVRPRRGETIRAASLRHMRELMVKRLQNYRRADFTVSTTGKTVPQIVDEILNILGNTYDKHD
ncbi:MAG: shikimate kinase [Candidatus Zixiibacteriota bacterium]